SDTRLRQRRETATGFNRYFEFVGLIETAQVILPKRLVPSPRKYVSKTRLLRHHCLGDVHVGEDLLHVVVVFQRIDELQYSFAGFDVDVLGHLGDLRDFGRRRLDVLALQGVLYLREGGRVAGDLEEVAVLLHVLRARIEGQAHERVLVSRRGGHDEDAAAVEEEGYITGRAHLAAAALEDLADLAGGAVAIVGDDINEDGDAIGAEA